MKVHSERGCERNAPLVLHHKLMSPEKARIISAHVPIRDGISVDDILLNHILNGGFHLHLINVERYAPLIRSNESVFRGTGCHRSRSIYELLGEGYVVKERPWVMII